MGKASGRPPRTMFGEPEHQDLGGVLVKPRPNVLQVHRGRVQGLGKVQTKPVLHKGCVRKAPTNQPQRTQGTHQ